MQNDSIRDNTFALNLDLSTRSLPEDLKDPLGLKLFQYYDHVVAELMPWIDGPNNGWRTVMIPLALERPSLLSAILALASKHLTSKSDPEPPNLSAIGSDHYRDAALRLVSHDLHSEMTENVKADRSGRAAAILGTILVLCQLEMVRLDASLWRVHWNAVRTITQRWTAAESSPLALDETCRFLIKEAFVYDVFGSSTAFENGGHISGEVIADRDVDIFIDYLRLIQDVTQAERSQHGNVQNMSAATKVYDILSLCRAFEYTRNQNRDLAGKIEHLSEEARNNLVIVIEIFHHSGLVYSFQALIHPQESTQAIQDHVQRLMEFLNRAKDGKSIQHDLVWPLFILGTEARDSLDIQRFTEQRLQEIMKATGFRNCQPALAFLHRFWAIDRAIAPNWIAHARQESVTGSASWWCDTTSAILDNAKYSEALSGLTRLIASHQTGGVVGSFCSHIDSLLIFDTEQDSHRILVFHKPHRWETDAISKQTLSLGW